MNSLAAGKSCQSNCITAVVNYRRTEPASKAPGMVVRSIFLFLLAGFLSPSRSLAFPQSLRSSIQDKYSLSGTVVNSVTGEAIRGALVQIYINGQSARLTGPDGKFQFDGLFAGQTPITVRKPGFFSEEDLENGLPKFRRPAVDIGPDVSPAILNLVPEGVIYGRITGDDGEPIRSEERRVGKEGR